MSAFVLITGALAKPPQQRTSKNGNPYLTASIRVTAGNETEWWNVLAFSESGQAEILRLGTGDKLSAQGILKIEIYRGNDGESRISRTIIADAVLALKPAPRERKAKADKAFRAAPAKAKAAGGAAPSLPNDDGRTFSDPLPF